MKKLFVLAVAASVVIGVASVRAGGDGCCAGMSKSSAKGGCCGNMFSKLNLTDAQKAQIETLKADTRRATSTSEMHQMFSAGLEKILTPDQLAQWESHSGKAMKSGACPAMNSAKTNKQT